MFREDASTALRDRSYIEQMKAEILRRAEEMSEDEEEDEEDTMADVIDRIRDGERERSRKALLVTKDDMRDNAGLRDGGKQQSGALHLYFRLCTQMQSKIELERTRSNRL